MKHQPHPQLLLMPNGGFSPFDLGSKLIGWISLDDESGGTIADRLQATTATLIGSPSISVNGNGRRQLTVNGTSQAIQWASTAAMVATDSIGFAFWLYLDVNTGTRPFVEQMVGPVNRVFWRVESGSFSRLYETASFAQNVNVTAAAPTGQWVWFCLTYDASLSGPTSQNHNRLSIYYDETDQPYTSTSVGGGDEIPPALNSGYTDPTHLLGRSGSGFLQGRMGPNAYILGNGKLTSTENTLLRNFQTMEGAS